MLQVSNVSLHFSDRKLYDHVNLKLVLATVTELSAQTVLENQPF